MTIDEIVGQIIRAYYDENMPKKTGRVMSRQRLPCTRCGTTISTTWRPGPCGTSSLCNKCGLLYTQRGDRPRMIDLIRDDDITIWMERNPESFQWQEHSVADMKDPRIIRWSRNEDERVEIMSSKKRKFVDI